MTEEKKAKLPKEIEKAAEQFDKFDNEVKAMTHDRLNETPRQEEEAQTKLSSKEIRNSKDIYLKPKTSISSPDKFNEKFRKDYEFSKEYVQFIAENKEIVGESITAWTKPFAGISAEEWVVPVNKPVWGPRYLAEQIKRKFYHRMVMKQETISGNDSVGSYFGSMAVDTTIQRLDAYPVIQNRSVFMGK
jgi:hypothetical protein